ncbi:MAG: histone deacetylase [Acidobacteria bacterium]|nr:histone deacetylase [Acidobacteriota bacterium]
MKVIYSDGYDLSLGNHVFPSQKYRLAMERLVERSVVAEGDVVEPPRARDEEVELVHSPGYVSRLKTGALSREEILRLEVPYSRRFADAVWLSAGGTIEACRRALEEGISVNLSGGFHHAFAGHGEGFCALNDVAIGMRTMQKERRILTAMVVDCDVHHGNGTAAIFHHDPTVFTLSLHQLNNYPFIKPPSNIDVHLDDGTGDEEYLDRLQDALERALAEFNPGLIVYLAGADPYCQDQLGGLSLTIDGLRRRDALVFREAGARRIPVAATLAGGYAVDVNDTVAIHVNTVRSALESASR